MFKVGISGFRVFEDTQEVEIRPLTLLTGGNSSGKSSFLSALRLIADASNATGGISFNKDPFFLGSYDQIAHHRGGRYGRVKAFTFHYCGRVRDNRRVYVRDDERLPENPHVSLEFSKRMGQAAISRIVYSSEISTLEAKFSAEWDELHVSATIGQTTISAKSSSENLPTESVISQPHLLASFVESILFNAYRTQKRVSKEMHQALEVATHFRAAISLVPPAGFVGAPVRTRPSRTYDPTDTSPQSEGSHVPSQMAQLARTRPTEWLKTRNEIVQFGKTSGLFDDIEVRRLGRGDSDPFQLNVTINGPKRNIVDVGYGVSQAIPIIFELARRARGSIYIMQQPEVHLHPEAQAALGTYVCGSLKTMPGYTVLETHSDFLIDRIRRHIRDETINRSDVSLLYFHRDGFSSHITQLNLNDRGEIENAPDGYRDFFLREQFANLGF